MLGTIYDADGFGMGHLPLSRKEFRSWQPVFITRTSLSKEELEGYEIGKQLGGGIWEIPK
jgi:hypothetical protein